MRIDLYTKTILTLIVLLLAVIALKPIFQPQPALGQGSLNGVQFCAIEGGLYAADMRTGDIWVYVTHPASPLNGQVVSHYKLAQLGTPLIKIK
jgi:hypothetical protein